MYTFGRGQHGQLGQGTFLFEADFPKPLPLFHKGSVRHVTCGEGHTALITGKLSHFTCHIIYIISGLFVVVSNQVSPR